MSLIHNQGGIKGVFIWLCNRFLYRRCCPFVVDMIIVVVIIIVIIIFLYRHVRDLNAIYERKLQVNERFILIPVSLRGILKVN